MTLVCIALNFLIITKAMTNAYPSLHLANSSGMKNHLQGIDWENWALKGNCKN